VEQFFLVVEVEGEVGKVVMGSMFVVGSASAAVLVDLVDLVVLGKDIIRLMLLVLLAVHLLALVESLVVFMLLVRVLVVMEELVVLGELLVILEILVDRVLVLDLKEPFLVGLVLVLVLVGMPM
jgi:hypothetical protein